MMTTPGPRRPMRPTRPSGLAFVDDGGTYSGTDAGDRWWQITQVYTGWRLEFRDPGDRKSTFAGTHRTLAAAQAEAAR